MSSGDRVERVLASGRLLSLGRLALAVCWALGAPTDALEPRFGLGAAQLVAPCPNPIDVRRRAGERSLEHPPHHVDVVEQLLDEITQVHAGDLGKIGVVLVARHATKLTRRLRAMST
jgi:hypothetical protein